MAATPDMADALSMGAATKSSAPADDYGLGAAADGGTGPAGQDEMELGSGKDETDLDPVFAADAQDLFPDWSDDDFKKFQALIDSRVAAGGSSAPPA